jgi:hypothetical protein
MNREQIKGPIWHKPEWVNGDGVGMNPHLPPLTVANKQLKETWQFSYSHILENDGRAGNGGWPDE